MKESIILNKHCINKEEAKNFYDILKTRLTDRLATTISFEYVNEISDEFLKTMFGDLINEFSIFKMNAYIFFDAISLEHSESLLRVLYPGI